MVIRALQNALSSLDPNDASVDPSDTSFPDPNKSIDCTRAFRQGSAVIVPEIDAVTVELKNQALTAQKRTELTAELDKLNLQFAKLTVAYTNCLGKVHKIS